MKARLSAILAKSARNWAPLKARLEDTLVPTIDGVATGGLIPADDVASGEFIIAPDDRRSSISHDGFYACQRSLWCAVARRPASPEPCPGSSRSAPTTLVRFTSR